MNFKSAVEKIRKRLESGRPVVIVVTLAVLAISIGAISKFLRSTSNSQEPEFFYMDLSTGKLFTSRRVEASPITVPGTTAKAAEAAVFACGSCADASRRFVGYLTLYEASAKSKVDALTDAGMKAGLDPVTAVNYAMEQAQTDPSIAAGRMMGLPPTMDNKKGTQFFSVDSKEAAAILESLHSRCSENELAPCAPTDVAAPK